MTLQSAIRKPSKYISRPISKDAFLRKFQHVANTSTLFMLEKAQKVKRGGTVTLDDIAEALEEFSRLFKAGIASNAEKLTLARAFPDNIKYTEAASQVPEDAVMVVGGPASVSLIDREGHLITPEALGNAFDKYMRNFRTRNAMVLHSDVQVGWALPAYVTKGGQIYKSGINGDTLFFICEVRDDTKISDKVKEQIKDGKLKSYSIAGSATKIQNMQKGLMPYMQVDEMELAEVTVCEKGVNQGANFELLKADMQPELVLTSKEDAHYREAGELQNALNINCGSCVHFNGDNENCHLVEGIIEESDYCDLYEPKEDSPDTMATEPEEIRGDKNPDIEIHIQLMKKENGDIDFTKSFLNLMKREVFGAGDFKEKRKRPRSRAEDWPEEHDPESTANLMRQPPINFPKSPLGPEQITIQPKRETESEGPRKKRKYQRKAGKVTVIKPEELIDPDMGRQYEEPSARFTVMPIEEAKRAVRESAEAKKSSPKKKGKSNRQKALQRYLDSRRKEQKPDDTNLENFIKYIKPEWDSSKVQKQSGIENGHPTFDWGEYGLKGGN